MPFRNNGTNGIAGESKDTDFTLSVSTLPFPHFSARARIPFVTKRQITTTMVMAEQARRRHRPTRPRRLLPLAGRIPRHGDGHGTEI